MQIIIRGNELLFYDTHSQMTTTIEGIRLSKAGVLKEFPDLKDDYDWKKKTIERFKEHIRTLKTEMEKVNYVKDELVKHGYTPLYYQRAGFREKKFK